MIERPFHERLMTGVKQFDRNQVLDRAIWVFWQSGYQATSIQDLVDATGVNRGSLYATFGDKCGLFIAVLDYYAEQIARPTMNELDDPDPRLIRLWNVRAPATLLGAKIAGRVVRQESAIYQVLRRAQREGSLDPKQDARAMARFFLGVAQGLNVVNKAAPDPRRLKDMVKMAMRVWDRRKSTLRSGAARARARRTEASSNLLRIRKD